MPRNRTAPAVEATPTFSIGKVSPPKRNRTVKPVLSPEILSVLRENVDTESWTTNGVLYDGEDGLKTAQSESRIWRRDLARFLDREEKSIRTRTWQDGDGYRFALRLRADGDTTTTEDAA